MEADGVESSTSGSMVLAVLAVLAAAVFAGLAYFYATVNSNLLASEISTHPKHAVLSGILAIACLIAANFLRPKRAA